MVKEKLVIPSLIAKSQNELDKRINKVRDVAELFQLDIMDNEFVPNHSLNFNFEVPDDLKFEAHLMIKDPDAWVQKHGDKVETILVHAECCKDLEATIHNLRGNNKIGIAINPGTLLEVLNGILDKIDQVLIMTVIPGFYGSPFMPEMLDKVRELRELKPDLDIEVDGGMDLDNIILANTAGANMFVSGSYLMLAKNVVETMNELMVYLAQN